MSYVRTAEHRAAVAARNAILKRKYPIGYGATSRLYRIWRAMKFRCYQKSHAAQPRYAAKGITVCTEWRNSYATFCEWALNNGYEERLTIDRIDNAGSYTPDNCRWVDYRTQIRNSDREFLPPVLAFGEMKPLIDWADDPRCAVHYGLLWKRYKRGMPLEMALVAPSRNKKFKGAPCKDRRRSN